MDKQSLIRIAGGLGGAVVVAVGLMATVPHIDAVEAAQDQTPAQGERAEPATLMMA